MPTIQEMLENQDYVITDGAMGTLLFAAGLEQGDPPEFEVECQSADRPEQQSGKQGKTCHIKTTPVGQVG